MTDDIDERLKGDFEPDVRPFEWPERPPVRIRPLPRQPELFREVNMSETFEKVQVHKSDNYTVLDNHALRNTLLPLRAKGLYSMIMSLPKTWDFNVMGLIKLVPEGKEYVYATIKELVTFGYCRREQQRNGNRYGRATYHFYETPFQHPALQETEKPDTEFEHLDSQYAVNPSQLSKDLIKQTPNNTGGQVDDVWDVPTHTHEGDGLGFFADCEAQQESQPKKVLEFVQPKPDSQAQKMLFKDAKREGKKSFTLSPEPIPPAYRMMVYRLAYGIESEQESTILTDDQTGRVAKVLRKLMDAGADLQQVPLFDMWWKTTWMAKSKTNDSYVAPRPEQIQEHWFVAMKWIKDKSNAKPTAPVPFTNEKKQSSTELYAAMARRASELNK